MISICWNCRGLGKSSAVRQLSRLAKSCNPQILFLSETRLKESEAESLKWKLGFECGIFVACQGEGRTRSGGLILLWRRDLKISLLSYSLHHIDVEVPGSIPWRFTGFYGWPCTEDREQSWSLLRGLKEKSSLPWLCGGDFNEILSLSEKRGGQLVRSARMEAFGSVVRDCGFKEVYQKGIFYTWSNGREDSHHIDEKLDRMFATEEWFEMFPASWVEALARIEFDHSLLISHLWKEVEERPSKIFRYETMWSRHPDFGQEIVSAWSTGANVDIVTRQIRCANYLRQWSTTVFGSVRHSKIQLEKEISNLQALPLTPERRRRIDECLKMREEILSREEMMWVQRSRIDWLREGDRNTKFFHQKAKQRGVRNRIVEIKTDGGVQVSGWKGIERVFRDFFTSLFTSDQVQTETITRKVLPRVTPDMNALLTHPFTQEEVIGALNQMHPTKAPGLDGMPPVFYQQNWKLVGDAVTRSVLSILNEGADPTPLNQTIIALIPKVNGQIGDHFTPERGLRQGDPLSPYLFLICAEGLGVLLKDAAETRILHGIMVAQRAPIVTHLFFADDALLFIRASELDILTALGILNTYASASGVKLGEESDHYLGLPMIIGRSKKVVFATLEDRIRKKVGTWKEASLSRAGRETLIKSVLQSIPTYIMSCFKLPLELCENIEQLLCRFYWGGTEETRKIHWRSWNRMCRSKAEGGLGFRKLQNFNRAMLAKQAWRIICCPESLAAKVLKARYFPRGSLLNAKAGFNPSFIWRSIHESLLLLAPNLEWRVGDGTLINIWEDRWIPGSPTGFPKYLWPGSDHFQFVHELLDPNSYAWNNELLNILFEPEDVIAILSIQLSPRRPMDIQRWSHTAEGIYSVKSGYYTDFSNWWLSNDLSNLPMLSRDIWKLCWSLFAPPRIKSFLWRVLDNCLPLRFNLQQRGIEIDTSCPVCGSYTETALHLFFRCGLMINLWQAAGYNILEAPTTSLVEAYTWLLSGSDEQDQGRKVTFMWGLWKFRNHVVFRQGSLSEASSVIMSELRLWEDFVANADRPKTNLKGIQAGWQAPEPGWFKVNTDAATHLEDGGRIGVVIRDSVGSFLAGMARCYPLIHHPTMLEAIGVRCGIELACSMGLSCVVFESDCLPIIQALNRTSLDKSDLSVVIEDCRVGVRNLSVHRFVYANRKANQLAHHMAKIRINDGSLQSFFSAIPVELGKFLDEDLACLDTSGRDSPCL